MRVAILHNAVPPDAPLEDQDTLVQVRVVAEALTRLGHEPTAVACTLDLAELRRELEQLRPDMVFNLVESLAGADSLVYLPLGVLDVLGLPYTGGGTEALFLTTHKLMAKERMQHAGLPTPGWMECRAKAMDVRCHHPKPFSEGEGTKRHWIIKGVWDQASRGMEDDAVLHDADEAEVHRRLAERFARSGRPCFAEQFIAGREFNLSVLAGSNGPQVLSPAEIDFSAFPPGKPRIVGHKAKWQADSFEFNNTPRRFDFAPADTPLLDQLRRLAASCWTLFDLHGWVRVDFRVDAQGQPWILEINANPCLSPDAGFAAALERHGIPFDQAIQQIVEDAVQP